MSLFIYDDGFEAMPLTRFIYFDFIYTTWVGLGSGSKARAPLSYGLHKTTVLNHPGPSYALARKPFKLLT